MILVPLIATLWTAGLLLVAGLCAAARRGDIASASAAVLEQPSPEHLVSAIPPRAHEPAPQAARAAA
jgi:hypothetical protein